MDGIGQPNVEGFGDALPGQTTVPLGTIITGESGDSTFRPTWATGGSFLAFRKLKQLVPEFNQFLWDNAIQMSGMTQQQGADLLGARMIGRWKSVRIFRRCMVISNLSIYIYREHLLICLLWLIIPSLRPIPLGTTISITLMMALISIQIKLTVPSLLTFVKLILVPISTHRTLSITSFDLVSPMVLKVNPYPHWICIPSFDTALILILVTDGEASSNTTSIDRGLAFGKCPHIWLRRDS